MKRTSTITAAASVALALSFALTGCSASEDDQMKDAVADLKLLGYRGIGSANIEKASFTMDLAAGKTTGGSGGSTEKVIEVQVTVAGCTVEIERKKDESNVARTVKKGGKKYKIETLAVDEVLHDGKSIDADEGPEGAPTPTDVEKFLRGKRVDGQKLGCLNG